MSLQVWQTNNSWQRSNFCGEGEARAEVCKCKVTGN